MLCEPSPLARHRIGAYSRSPTRASASSHLRRAAGGAHRRRRMRRPRAGSRHRDEPPSPQVRRDVRLRHPRAADARHRWDSFRTIAKSRGGLVALAAVAMLVVLVLPLQS